MKTCSILVLLLAASWCPAQTLSRRDGPLKPGDAAPNFQIQDVAGKKTVKLSGLTGKPVVLIFGSCT